MQHHCMQWCDTKRAQIIILMIKWFCRAVMFLLLTTISITGALLIAGKPWYYNVGLCVLMAAIGCAYAYVETWFINRREPVNPGHFTEVADRAACLAQMIIRVLLDHPVVQQSNDLKLLAEEAESAVKKLNLIAVKSSEVAHKDLVIHDRAWWFWESFDDLIVENPIIQNDPETLNLADAASDNLWKLYQHLAERYI